jgi:hypothetical protein
MLAFVFMYVCIGKVLLSSMKVARESE